MILRFLFVVGISDFLSLDFVSALEGNYAFSLRNIIFLKVINRPTFLQQIKAVLLFKRYS